MCSCAPRGFFDPAGAVHHRRQKLEIGMAAKDDGESAREEGDQIIVDLALQAVYRGTGKRKWVLERVRVGTTNGIKVAKRGGERVRGRGEEPMAENGRQWQEGSNGQEKGAKGETRACRTCTTV